MVIMGTEKRIEVALKNLGRICSDIVYKNNKYVARVNPENYLQDKKNNLMTLAEDIADEEKRKSIKSEIEAKFKEAEDFLWKHNNGTMFDAQGSDLT